MSLETAPPRESISGTRPKQIEAMERGIEIYARLLELDEEVNSTDYAAYSQDEKDLVDAEFSTALAYYDKNQSRVATY